MITVPRKKNRTTINKSDYADSCKEYFIAILLVFITNSLCPMYFMTQGYHIKPKNNIILHRNLKFIVAARILRCKRNEEMKGESL